MSRSISATPLAAPAFACACACACLNALPAWAGEPAQADAGTTEIVVTAPRITVPYAEAPGATTVVTQEDLRVAPKTISAGEALALVPGLKVDTQYDSEKSHVSIRGQGILTERGIRGIEVLLDGIPLNDPSGFAPDLYDVDWAGVRRIEVIRGPSGALYGGGSSAGVINVVTQDGGEGEAGLSATFGANGFWKARGAYGEGDDHAAFRISAARTMGDGNRDHSAFAGTNVYGKAHFHPSAGVRLTAVLAGTSYFNENPEGLNRAQLEADPYQANPDSATYNEYARTRRVTAGLSGSVQSGAGASGASTLDFSVYGRRTEFTESVPSTVQHRTITNPGAFALYSFGLGAHRFGIGADVSAQHIDEYRNPHVPGSPATTDERVADQVIRQSAYGVHVMDHVELAAHWGVFANLRYDRVHQALTDHLQNEAIGDLSGARDFSRTTGRLGVTWNPRADFGMYATWGQGFTPPSTEEMLANPVHQGGFNEVIVPATSRGEELGARGTWKRLTYDVAVFHLDTSDDFERYRIAERPLETFYGNAGDTRRYGLELSTAWTPAPPLAVRAAYTYSHFTYREIRSLVFPSATAGNTLPNSPQHQAYVDVRWGITPSWYAGVSAEVQSRNEVDPTNVPYTPGYALYHARVGWRWHTKTLHGEIDLALRNAFDKVYVAFTEPDPDGNSYQAGPGREWFAGVRIALGER